MSRVFVIFPDKATADEVLKEMCITPALENGTGPVRLWWNPESPTNTIQYAYASDGRVCICHHWNEVTADWITGYCSEQWPAVRVLAALPEDWISV